MKAILSRGLAIGAALISFVLPAASQTAGGATAQTALCPVNPGALAVRQPASYTAEFKITHVQTLANGATITRESTRIQARDLEGRTMNSDTSTQPFGNGETMTMVFIQDHKGGTQTNWNSRTRKATIIVFPPKEQQHGCWTSEAGRMTMQYAGSAPLAGGTSATLPVHAPSVVARPKPVIENLGTMTIAGVEAHGQRFTNTISAGQIGNDQPLISTQETWQAPSLGLIVRTVRDDPQSGKETMEPVSITLGEPDPSVFQPPEGYEVVTETMVPCKDQQ